jgi:hypothetical protein
LSLRTSADHRCTGQARISPRDPWPLEQQQAEQQVDAVEWEWGGQQVQQQARVLVVLVVWVELLALVLVVSVELLALVLVVFLLCSGPKQMVLVVLVVLVQQELVVSVELLALVLVVFLLLCICPKQMVLVVLV